MRKGTIAYDRRLFFKAEGTNERQGTGMYFGSCGDGATTADAVGFCVGGG